MNKNIIELESKTQKEIKLGKQKQLFQDYKLEDIDIGILSKFNTSFNIKKVITCNDNEIEFILNTFEVTYNDYNNLLTISKLVYGENIEMYFVSENKFEIGVGVRKKR